MPLKDIAPNEDDLLNRHPQRHTRHPRTLGHRLSILANSQEIINQSKQTENRSHNKSRNLPTKPTSRQFRIKRKLRQPPVQGGGEYVSSTPPGRWEPSSPPSPSRALVGAPPPFKNPYSRGPDFDPPFHGFHSSDSEDDEVTQPDQGRPKRKVKQPDRLNYDTFAVRSLF